MLAYVTLGSNDLERAKQFYDVLFATIGVARTLDLQKGGAMWVFDAGGGRSTNFVILSPEDGRPAAVGNGTMVGLRLDTPRQVDAIHAAALAHGGSSEGEPGLRETNMPGTYIAYFRDPEGHKFAAFTTVTPEMVASGTLHRVR